MSGCCASVFPYLWSLCLNASHAAWAINDCVFRYNLKRVDLTEGSDDTAAGQDYITTDVRWNKNGKHSLKSESPTQSPQKAINTDPYYDTHILPLDSITLLSPIFRACETVSFCVKADNVKIEKDIRKNTRTCDSSCFCGTFEK